MSASSSGGVMVERAGDGEAAITIRPLRTHDELQACLALQRATWGDAPGTLVPTPLLLVVQRIGGVSAGAFDPAGTLLGFVFGMTGVENGELVHWSDMLAVVPGMRDRGLGRRLKLYQRDEVAKLGVRRVYWTYDPLVAKNAHFNLDVLGAQVHEYVADMYGDTGSTLHAGLGTDRIIVAWDVGVSREAAAASAEGRSDGERGARGDDDAGAASDDDRGVRRDDGDATHSRSTVTVPHWGERAVIVNDGGERFVPPDPGSPALRIEIPADIFAVRDRSPAQARAWRETSRAAFEWALARGYRTAGLARDEETGRTYYVLLHS